MLRRVATVSLALWLAGCAMAPTASTGDDSAAVAAAAERLRVAMIDPTRENLNPLIADELSYGHSSGKVDTKASFIADLLSGASDFVTITITEQTVKVLDGGVAIVRHTLAADTNDGGKPGKVLIKILAVWQKQGGQWKLIARQAVRPPA
jgi:hypothetical protein